MVKKIRRKLKVVRKVIAPGTSPGSENAEEIEEMVEGDESEDVEDDKNEEQKDDKTPSEEKDDDLGLAQTVTAPPDASETARRMKDLIEKGSSSGPMDAKKDLFPIPGSTDPVEPKSPKDPLTITKVEKEPVKATATPTKEPSPTPPPKPSVKPPQEDPEVPIADMELYEEDQTKDDKDEQEDTDFSKHREAMASTLDLQEKVMREIEADLFKKEEEVRDKLEEIKKANPEGLTEILDTVKSLDTDTIKDFVTAAETLYEGQFDKLPGDNKYWNDLKKKAGLDAKAAAAKPTVEPSPAKRDKAEEYRRREKAIDIFKRSVFQSQSGGLPNKLVSPLKARADASKDKGSSHFFGPAVKAPVAPGDKKREGAMSDFLRFGKADVTKTSERSTTELEKALAETRLKLADAEKSLAETKMELANIRATQGDRLHDLDQRVDELEEQVTSKDETISDLKAKLDETKKSTTKFQGQKEMTAEIEKLNRVIENLNYDVRTKNDVILGQEQMIKNLETEVERHLENAKTADVKTDDKARIEQLEELKIKSEELAKLEARTQKNLEELKEIAKDNMKAEYRLKRKEMLIENMEKNVDYQKRETDKRAADIERSRNEMEIRVESLDAREKEIVRKEEDHRLNKERIEQELENITEERKKAKNDLMEQARMDYRLDKRQQELRLQEMKVKQLEEAISKREELLKAKETEFKTSGGGLDTTRIDEVLKMKTAELARKEEALKSREDELESKRRSFENKVKINDLEGRPAGDKETAAFMERLKAREAEMSKREDELHKLESAIKDKWAQLQVEAKKVAGTGQVTGPGITAPVAGTGQDATEASAEIKPLLKVRCVGCRELIPIYSTVRPLKVQCPKCSKVGVLK